MKDKNKKTGQNHSPVLKNPIIFTVSVTLAVLFVFGAVTGGVFAVRASRAQISFEGVRIEQSAAAYLATTYKTDFMNEHRAVDDPSFWEAEFERGMTYGQLLEKETLQYLREVAVGAYLFDRYSSLTSDEKKMIKATAEDVITNYYGSFDKQAFNKDAARMGFDYKGFLDALTLKYKAERAMIRIYGSDGSVLAQGGYASECLKYYSTFAYVKLLFIRTEYEYATDENGEYLRDEAGNILTRPLTDEEKSQRNSDVKEIRDAILALQNGEDEQMSIGFFNSMLQRYNFDDYTTSGYFFSTVVDNRGVPLAAATESFALYVDADILDLAFSIGEGEYGELETDFGTCFVYRGELGNQLYTSDRYEYFFSDFYSDAAVYLYLDTLNELSEQVKVKDGFFDRVNVVELPYNSQFRANGYVD